LNYWLTWWPKSRVLIIGNIVFSLLFTNPGKIFRVRELDLGLKTMQAIYIDSELPAVFWIRYSLFARDEVIVNEAESQINKDQQSTCIELLFETFSCFHHHALIKFIEQF